EVADELAALVYAVPDVRLDATLAGVGHRDAQAILRIAVGRDERAVRGTHAAVAPERGGDGLLARGAGVRVPARGAGVRGPARRAGVRGPARRAGVRLLARRAGVRGPARRAGVRGPARRAGVRGPAR